MVDAKSTSRRSGCSRWSGSPYTLKFLWSPIFPTASCPPSSAGARGWLLITQLGLFVAVAGLSFAQPERSPWMVALLALG